MKVGQHELVFLLKPFVQNNYLTLYVSQIWQNNTPLPVVTSVIDGLKMLYNDKLKPLEATYRFNDFVSPFLVS